MLNTLNWGRINNEYIWTNLPIFNKWSCDFCKIVPTDFAGKLKTSLATTTFHDKPNVDKTPFQKKGVIDFRTIFLKTWIFVKLNTFAICKRELSILLNPLWIDVIIIGKDIKTEVTIGTVPDLNQNKIKRITEITGVTLIIAKGIFKKELKNSEYPQKIPKIKPTKILIKKAENVLPIVTRTFCQNMFCVHKFIIV